MRKPLAAREQMVRTDAGSLSETTVARIDRGGNPLPEPDLRAPGRKGPGLAGQDLRGWDHSRGLVSFLGQRAAEIGTDGEAAVQAGKAQQLRALPPVTARLRGDGGQAALPPPRVLPLRPGPRAALPSSLPPPPPLYPPPLVPP